MNGWKIGDRGGTLKFRLKNISVSMTPEVFEENVKLTQEKYKILRGGGLKYYIIIQTPSSTS